MTSQGEWLTREQVDQVVESLSANDLIESGLAGNQDQAESVKAAAVAFNMAAKRIGLANGTLATEHMRAVDLAYFAQALKAYMDIDSPKSETLEGSPASATSGE